MQPEKVQPERCNLAPRSISLNCAGCSEEPEPDWMQWPKEIDAITKRSRTPNDPYTKLSPEMVANITKDTSPHFRTLRTEDASICSGDKCLTDGRTRYFKDRYADIINKHLLRGQPTSTNFGIITPEKYFKEAQEPYTTCSQEAFEKWPGQMAGQLWLGDASQQKGGLATKSHQFGEVRERFTTIDMYRRQNTNCPGESVMKFGRPGHGYYLQRYPTEEPYFGSEFALNKRDVLDHIHPKTLAEYKERAAVARQEYTRREERWPHISEYNDRYARKTSTLPICRNPRDKQMVEEVSRARNECNLLESK